MKKEQFRAMPLKKKIKYLTGKYTWHIIFDLFVISLLGSWFYLEYMVEQPLLRIEMIDASLDAPSSAAFETFMEQEGLGCDDQKVKVSKVIQLGDEPQDIKGDPERLIYCRTAACRTDLYFWNDPYTEEALAKYDLCDLRTVLPPEVLLACEDRLIYTAPLLQGGYPCAIHLKDCQWIEENGLYEDCAVGISRNAKDTDLVQSFIEYII